MVKDNGQLNAEQQINKDERSLPEPPNAKAAFVI